MRLGNRSALGRSLSQGFSCRPIDGIWIPKMGSFDSLLLTRLYKATRTSGPPCYAQDHHAWLDFEAPIPCSCAFNAVHL